MMRERHRLIGRSVLDFSAALLSQLTQLGATLLIFGFDSLRNAAYFTFSFSICGPLWLFAGMSLMELLFSGHENYRHSREIALAQMLLFVGLVLLTGIGIGLWDPAYLPCFALVALSRLFDLVAALSLHIMRRNGWFTRIALAGLIQFVAFAVAAAAALWLKPAAPYLSIAGAVLVASFVQLALSLYWLRDEFFAPESAAQPMHPLRFIRRHVPRSVAISLNSVQANIPRLGLELLVSPQHQAAYSLLYTVSRAGTIGLQSLFVPIVGYFRTALANNPRRAIIRANGAFFIISLGFTALMAVVWLIAHKLDLVRLIGEAATILTPGTGIVILIASGAYLFRFGVWQIVSLLEGGGRQTRYALWGAGLTAIGAAALVSPLGITGAVICEVIGNIALVALPIGHWLKRPATTSEN